MTLATQLGEALAKASAKGALQRLTSKGGKQKLEKILMGVTGAPGVALGEAVM